MLNLNKGFSFLLLRNKMRVGNHAHLFDVFLEYK